MFNNNITSGIISARPGYENNINMYTLSVPFQPGNSGGPVFDYNGNLIGIVNAKIMAADNVSYAVKVDYLNALLNMLNEPISLPKTGSLTGKDLLSVTDSINRFIVHINVY